MSDDEREEEDLSHLFSIEMNAHALAREWSEQAGRYHHHAVALADARMEHDRAKARLDVIVAELDRDIRSNPARYGIGKLNNDVVDRAVVMQAVHKQALARLIELKHDMDVRAAVVAALEHKKRGLESMVSLLGKALFAEPNEKATEVFSTKGSAR